MTYDQAVAELYQAPHADFVATRKRLAGELKPTDKDGAAKLAKQARPPISAWAVNQLWWHARADFDHMLETAARIRKGDLAASAEHRDAIAKLRARASKLLEEGGHGATESTLRRVTTTLSAIAVEGSFDGALSEDRDPPGFDAIMGDVPAPISEPKPKKKAEDDDHKRAQEEAHARRKAEEAERARQAAARNRLETALRTAKAEAAIRERNVESLRDQLKEAERLAAKAQAAVDEIQGELDAE